MIPGCSGQQPGHNEPQQYTGNADVDKEHEVYIPHYYARGNYNRSYCSRAKNAPVFQLAVFHRHYINAKHHFRSRFQCLCLLAGQYENIDGHDDHAQDGVAVLQHFE